MSIVPHQSTTTPQSCPPWCSLPPGHPFTGGGRVHEGALRVVAAFGDGSTVHLRSVTPQQFESRDDTGAVLVHEPDVVLDDGAELPFSPSAARELAAALVAAADEIEGERA